MKKHRLSTIDSIRGITICSMIIYHFIWDLVYIAGIHAPWYLSSGAYIWQQSICWTFILLSGFCSSLSSRTIKRGLIVFAGGAVVTLITLLVTPESKVIFGILTFMGSAMIITGLLKRFLDRISPAPGLIISFIIFILLRDVNAGYLGFDKFRLLALPRLLYRNILTTFLGFPRPGFYSSDYFSLLPWIFLYFTGYYICRFLGTLSVSAGPSDKSPEGGDPNKATAEIKKETLFDKAPFHIRIPVFELLGKHSLLIYMLHQPLLYGITLLIITLQNR